MGIRASKRYSAAVVKQLFWFAEFRCVLRLLLEGYSFDDIKKRNLDENLFGAVSQSRGVFILSTVWRRVNGLPAIAFDKIEKSDVATQKIVVLLAIMLDDLLFFEFMYDVIREKFLLKDDKFSDKEFRIFFDNKQRESEKVELWTDYTIKKISTVYRGYLVESGIFDADQGALKKPFMDIEVEMLLRDLGMNQYLKVLTGER